MVIRVYRLILSLQKVIQIKKNLWGKHLLHTKVKMTFFQLRKSPLVLHKDIEVNKTKCEGIEVRILFWGIEVPRLSVLGGWCWRWLLPAGPGCAQRRRRAVWASLPLKTQRRVPLPFRARRARPPQRGKLVSPPWPLVHLPARCLRKCSWCLFGGVGLRRFEFGCLIVCVRFSCWENSSITLWTCTRIIPANMRGCVQKISGMLIGLFPCRSTWKCCTGDCYI